MNHKAGSLLQRRGWLAVVTACACAWVFAGPAPASAQQVLTVAAYPAVDEIVRAAIPAWKRLHPTVPARWPRVLRAVIIAPCFVVASRSGVLTMRPVSPTEKFGKL